MTMENERYAFIVDMLDSIPADHFALGEWFDPKDTESPFSPPETIEDVHSCGGSACVGGYLSLTDKWRNSGGGTSPETLRPIYGVYNGADAVVEWVNEVSPPLSSYTEGRLYDLCSNALYSLAVDIGVEHNPQACADILRAVAEGPDALVTVEITLDKLI